MLSASIIHPASVKDSVAHYTIEDNYALNLLNLFRLHISPKSVNDDKIYNANAADGSFYNNHILATERKEAGATGIPLVMKLFLLFNSDKENAA
ncbi:hypothetical protein BH10BAC3_BH10BAC3_31540 [soil metagenome]